MQVRELKRRTLLHFLSGGRERNSAPQKKAVDAKCAHRQDVLFLITKPTALPQVPVLFLLAVMVPVGIALIGTKLLRCSMHYAFFAQHLIVGLALWVVVDDATAIVAAHFKISVNHFSLAL